MDEKEFIQMEPVLQKISKTLSLGDDKKDYIDAYEEIRSEFLQALRTEDPIFDYYKKIQLMGSSYEKTRIRVADEFDMNICIKLPFDNKQVIIENGPTRGFVTIKIPGQLDLLKKSPHWANFKSIDRWIDKDDFVLQNKLREWMQSVSQKAIDNLKKTSNAVWSKYNVAMKPVGPSIGLWVTHRSKGIEFSVDFVPVLVFKHPIWPSYVPQKYANQFSTNEWYAVPKHSSNNQVIAGKLWRISFPQQECDMLKGKNQMRVAQRMIKQLRENREFTFLKSYFIKSVFMLMVEQKKGEPLFWEKRVSYLFMFMLNDVLEKVTKGCIPFFWDRSYNLLSVLKPNQLNHCRQSLQGSITFIKKNVADEQKIRNHLMPGGSNNIENDFVIVPKSKVEITEEKQHLDQKPKVNLKSKPKPTLNVSAVEDKMKNLTVDKMEEKDFIKMEPALKNINKRLSLEDDKKLYIDSLNEIKAEFLQALRAEDPILNFYKKTLLTDEKINIKGVYEFDINVCIKLPFDCRQLNLQNGPSRGVVTIQIPGQLGKLKKSPQWENFKSIDLWIDKDDYVLQIKLREWMRSVSVKAIDALKKSSNVIWSKYEVEMNSSGRRITLFVVHRQSNIKFSVNFFPALVFKESIWPSRVPKKYASEFSIDEWHAVPGQDSSCEPALSGKLWWISFPQQECNMLKGKQQLKITQQLIELLRENREFTFIKSYIIKSVFMLMVEQKKGDSSFWQKNLGYLFMVMLTDLHDRVSEGRIPFFWDRDYNMLSSTKPNQLNGCKQSLRGSIKFIVKNYTDHDKILTHLMPAGICISNENGLNIKLNDECGINISGDNCIKSSKKHDLKPNEEHDINLNRNNGVKSNEEHDIKLYDKNNVKISEKSNVKTNKESDMRLNENFIRKKNEESDVNQNEDHNVNLAIEEHDKKHNDDHLEKSNKENDVRSIEEHDKKLNEDHLEKTNKENDVRSIEEHDKKLNEDHLEKPNKENDVRSIEEHDKKLNEDHLEKKNKENDVRSIEEHDKKLNGDHVEKPNKENDVRSIEEHDKKLNEDRVEKPNKENDVKLNEETKLHVEHDLKSNKKNNSRPNEKHDEESNDEHYVQPKVKSADTKRNNCIIS